MEILYSFMGFGGLAVLIWVVRSIKRWGAADAKKAEAEKERDAARENLDRHLDRPRTTGDLVKRLLSWKSKL